jgi:hypothetical protein
MYLNFIISAVLYFGLVFEFEYMNIIKKWNKRYNKNTDGRLMV